MKAQNRLVQMDDAMADDLDTETGPPDTVVPARKVEQDEIAALAYQIYEEEGCADGCAESHWQEAERRLRERADHSSSGNGDRSRLQGALSTR